MTKKVELDASLKRGSMVKTKYIGFRVSNDVLQKIFKLKHEKTITQFFLELIDREISREGKSTEDFITTLRQVEKVMQKIENTCERGQQDRECIIRMDKILELQKLILETSVAIVASSPASANLIRRRYPTLIEDTLEKR